MNTNNFKVYTRPIRYYMPDDSGGSSSQHYQESPSNPQSKETIQENIPSIQPIGYPTHFNGISDNVKTVSQSSGQPIRSKIDSNAKASSSTAPIPCTISSEYPPNPKYHYHILGNGSYKYSYDSSKPQNLGVPYTQEPNISNSLPVTYRAYENNYPSNFVSNIEGPIISSNSSPIPDHSSTNMIDYSPPAINKFQEQTQVSPYFLDPTSGQIYMVYFPNDTSAKRSACTTEEAKCITYYLFESCLWLCSLVIYETCNVLSGLSACLNASGIYEDEIVIPNKSNSTTSDNKFNNSQDSNFEKIKY